MFTQEQLKSIEKSCEAMQEGLDSVLPDVNDFLDKFNQASIEAFEQKKRVRERLNSGARRTSTDVV